MRNFLPSLGLSAAVVAGAYAADGVPQPPASADLEVPACKLVKAHEIETYVGVPAVVRESSGEASTVGHCSWAGSTEGATVDVMFFPGPSHGVPKGDERAYFDQMIEGRKQKFQPGEFVAVPELADDAWALDVGDNPTQYFEVYLFKGRDNLTITSNGIGLEATVAIARQAAERME